MKNVPSRIEVVIEPHQFSAREDADTMMLTSRIIINGVEISSRVIKPLDFFISHFDRAMEEAKHLIRRELFD